MKTKTVLLGVLASVIVLLGAQMRPDVPVAQLKQKYADATSRFVDIDGLSVHYRDEGAGPPLVLLHGTASSLHTWDTWTAALRGSFRVIRVDLPGFGLTGPNAQHDYSTDAYVAFVDRFLDKLDIRRAHLAGNSLGGRIAWEYVLAHPGKVDKLVLIDATGYPRPTSSFIFTWGSTPVLNRLLLYLTPRWLVESSVKEHYADDGKVTPALVDRYYELTRRPGNRAAFIARLRAAGDAGNYQKLGAIKAPTLILWGAEDLAVPLEDGQRLAKDIPGATLIVYDGVGHMPMEEAPEKSAADVQRFLL